jgi:methionine synthase II (cobalamin-independent)
MTIRPYPASQGAGTRGLAGQATATQPDKLGIVAQHEWEPGTATGIGSMPGTDPAEAMRVIVGELEGFPHLPELPARGPGADMIGRTAALLIDMPVEVTPRGWRLAERPGRDLARARSMLSTDLDVLEEQLHDYQGPVKIQLAGPWTLAATLELTRTMNMALYDPGAVADLAGSLAEAASQHVKDVAKRLPHAQIITQFDEPALTAVAEGTIPTASGMSRLAAVEEEPLRERLSQVLDAVPGYTIVHCCATTARFEIMRRAGAGAISFDLGQLRLGEEDAVAEAADAGLGLFVGVDGAAKETAERVLRLWHRMGIPARSEQTVITPGCGLAGASPEEARATLARCHEAARILAEMIGETA